MQRLKGFKILTWNVGKLNWNRLGDALKWLCRKLSSSDFIICLQEVERWPEGAIVDGWEVKHALGSHTAICWPLPIANVVSCRFESQKYACALNFNHLTICSCYLPDINHPLPLFLEAIDQIMHIRSKCSAMGANKFAFFGDLNVHMPSDVDLVTGTNAYEDWAGDVHSERIAAVIRLCQRTRCRLSSTFGTKKSFFANRTFSKGGSHSLIGYAGLPVDWRCKHLSINDEEINIAGHHRDHYPLWTQIQEQSVKVSVLSRRKVATGWCPKTNADEDRFKARCEIKSRGMLGSKLTDEQVAAKLD